MTFDEDHILTIARLCEQHGLVEQQQALYGLRNDMVAIRHRVSLPVDRAVTPERVNCAAMCALDVLRHVDHPVWVDLVVAWGLGSLV